LSRPLKLDFRAWKSGDAELRPVVSHIRAGGLVAYPTETVYGFGGSLRPRALARLGELKARDASKPFLLLVPSARSVDRLAWTDDAHELASVFWPGALALILADPDGVYPPEVRNASGGVAVRQSSHPLARRIVELLDEPVTSTSANVPGAPPASSGSEALSASVALGAGEELWVLDAGALPDSEPSTIVDCTGPTARIVRAGRTPVGRIRCVLPYIEPVESEPNGPQR
jgi:L-threonylcarbamoyladenylate synthase